MDYHQPYSDLFRECTVRLEQEVQKYGTAKSKRNNKYQLFADNWSVTAQDKDDAEYMTTN